MLGPCLSRQTGVKPVSLPPNLGLLKGAAVLPVWSKGTLRVRDIAKWVSSHRVMEIK